MKENKISKMSIFERVVIATLLFVIGSIYPFLVLAAEFQLPIEILGSEGSVKRQTFNLTQDQVDQAEKLFFYANNLGYENKGSIRVNGGDWISLNHTDIGIYEKEMGYGGMQHGGMNSIRFTIPDTDLAAGENIVRFRFDMSDGISIGYRIFEFNLLDQRGEKILPERFFEHDDPSLWQAPSDYNNVQAIADGKALWYGAELLNHYLPNGRVATWYGNQLQPQQTIKATCSDCHTQDGRDLEYFGYSNEAIQQRSQFHGLSVDESKKIAAYIRSLNVPRHGRPWNPPYQPGPSVGEKSIEYWAAGAGIDAVLETDAEMLDYMFPIGTMQWKIDDYFDSEKMHDTTTVPLAIQFPDWKHWLPLIHPKDAFDGFYSIQQQDGSFIPGDAAPQHNPFVTYPALREFFEQNDHDDIVANKDEFYELMGNFWSSNRNFFTAEIGKKASGHWRTKNSVADTYHDDLGPGFGQLARTSLARLMAVKFFEMHQEFELEEMTQRLIPAEDQPAPRQWLHAMGYNVFEVPPHFTAEGLSGRTSRYEGQPGITGKFETTNWYELQLVLNPGNGRPGLTGPVDFNYHPGFIRKSSAEGQPHPMRYYRAMNNIYQVKSFSGDEDATNKRRGFYLNQQGPWNIMPWDAPGFDEFEFTETLEQVKPGANLPVKFVNAMLTQLAVELEKPQNHPDTYSRRNNGSWFSLERASRTEYNPSGRGYADDLYRFMLRIKNTDMALDAERVNRVIDWCELAWPNMPWQDVRP